MISKLFALLCVFICIAASLPIIADGQSVSSVSIIMVDGEIVAAKSRNTPPAKRMAKVV